MSILYLTSERLNGDSVLGEWFQALYDVEKLIRVIQIDFVLRAIGRISFRVVDYIATDDGVALLLRFDRWE